MTDSWSVVLGGTGLNITEANHVCFLDRWFNPMVHSQAEDRCHRIGQTADKVNIFFADVATTVDEVMAFINLAKSTNASIILADGTEFSRNQDGALSYKDLAGLFGNLIRGVQSLRRARATGDLYNTPLSPIGQDTLEGLAERKPSPRKKSAVKSETSESASAVKSELLASLTGAPTSTTSATSSESSGSVAMEEDAVAALPPQPQHRYETLGGGTNVLLLSDDSDSDDDLLDDVKPTFKTG